MANNRRDLTIGITGESAGLDTAVRKSEDSLRGLDRELAKLTRDMTAQERVAARAAVAVKAYGSEQDKAALAARRLGVEAEKSATQAERAQLRADAAAKAYEKGLIDEAKASRIAAAAEGATERAAIKAAEAHRAAARAADEQAQQERKLARDAELAAAAEELGYLKASGQITRHNMLLNKLRSDYGNLSGTAVAGFKELEAAGGKASKALANFKLPFLPGGPVGLTILVESLQLIPKLASVAGGGIAVGLGGALTALGLKAQSSSVDVQNAFTQMKNDVLSDLHGISTPFHATLLEIAADAEAAFKSLEPALSAAFAEMAPATTRFVRYFAGSLSELDPAIRSIGTAFSNVLDNLGPQMPVIIGNIATGIKAITDAVASNPQSLTNFVTFLSQVVRYTGDTIGFLIRYSSEISTVFKTINAGLLPFTSLISLIMRIKGSTESGGKALAKYENTLGSISGTANATAQTIAHDMEVLASATSSAEDKAKALGDAFTRLLDPQAAVYSDSLQLTTGINDLGKALAASGGRLDATSQATVAAGTAFGSLLKTTQQTATDMVKAGASIGQVRQFLGPYVNALYRAAGGNQNARALVDSFVRSLGLMPPATDAAGRVLAGFGRGLDSIKVPATGAQLAAQQLGQDFTTLASKTATVEDKTNALSDAFTRLLDPSLAAFQDTAKLRQGLDDLAAALKKSHGAMNDNSQAARAAKDAFAGLLKDAEQYAGDLLRSGDSIDVVQRKLSGYILSLYRLAGSNRQAKALVDAFARSVGLVPNKKGTALYSNAVAAKKAVDAYQRSINGLHGKTVTIDQIVHQRIYTTQQLINKTSGPGYAHGGLIHRAGGGPVQHLAGGGPSGLVSGPGSATSDSIMTALSNGEFVTNAAATRANLPLLQALNAGRIVAAAPGMVSGASGGSAAGVDVGTLARAIGQALHGTTVQMDGKPVGQIVSRHLGRQTDQRRRTG